MFGYIKPNRLEMKIKEFETYKAVYCGLCKQMGKTFGPFARFTLSYDFTFLALLALGQRQQQVQFAKQSCAANPFRKKVCHMPCSGLDEVAALSMLTVYYKNTDTRQDGRWYEKLAAMAMGPFFNMARKKALKLYPHLDPVDRVFADAMQEQLALERQNCAMLDVAAEPTAKALSVMSASLSSDPTQKKVLERLGYLLGRYVYLMDAVDDYEKDKKHGNYNVFYCKYKDDTEEMVEYTKQMLNLTVGEIAATYALLTLHCFTPIVDNLVYLGLHCSQNAVLEQYYTHKANP